MNRTIQIVWWLGLGAALVGTLGIIKQVSLVLRALAHIHELAEFTRQAARGLADNLTVESRLSELERPADELRQAAAALASATRSVEQQVETMAPAGARRGDE